MCRVLGVTRQWLLGFLGQGVEAWPDHRHAHPVSCQHEVRVQRLEVKADAMASFVQKQAHQQWGGMALDATTRQLIALPVGARRPTSAEHLWAKIPHAYRQHAPLYPDQEGVYAKGMPAVPHKAISKVARQTHHIERCNTTLRQRVSRLVRDA